MEVLSVSDLTVSKCYWLESDGGWLQRLFCTL